MWFVRITLDKGKLWERGTKTIWMERPDKTFY